MTALVIGITPPAAAGYMVALALFYCMIFVIFSSKIRFSLSISVYLSILLVMECFNLKSMLEIQMGNQ